MKGKEIFSYIYDKMLYAYAYVEIVLCQWFDKVVDFRRNVNWIRKNGPYNG